MGIFDPPAVSIRKKTPEQSRTSFDEIEGKVRDLLPPNLNQTQAALVVACVMGGWVASEIRESRITMTDYNTRYVQNMVFNCFRRLGAMESHVWHITDQLTEAGLITPSTRL